jgi:purine-nucleoside phosphorylase
VYPNLEETVEFIRSECPVRPQVGIVLGSGLGSFAESLSGRAVFPYKDLPHFPLSTVPGHSGNCVLGLVSGVPVAALQGRVHQYEGYSSAEVAYPARVLGCLGIRQLIVTNAAGGINPGFTPGELMLITDHINLTGSNPLVGANLDELGPRFPDMSDAYDGSMRRIALEVAGQQGIVLRQGVYMGLLGPNYETPAEIRMCRALGADAVGMSTIPEVIAANHMGIPVLGLSCITNMAAGILPEKLSHQEVLGTMEKVEASFRSLLTEIIRQLGTA